MELNNHLCIDTNNTSKLGQCEVCGVSSAKYTCPKCEVKTCALKCSKIHKLELNCDGIRDPTKFISSAKFSNTDLLSDYRFLEEISRSVSGGASQLLKRNNHQSQGLQQLKNAARIRKTNLKTLPAHFTKRKNNTTYFNSENNTIFWHIEWIFGNADVALYDTNISETQKLGVLLERHLTQTDKSLMEQLQYYRSVGVPGVKLLLRVEQTAGKKFFELDSDLMLQECLKGKLIIEHPTIYVVLKNLAHEYEIVDSDNEDDHAEVQSGTDVINNILKNEEKETKSNKNNLLFTS
uniref:Box C/D snoRNA protein 1 n=1 Tax=Diabrotica virgifera virgifera TaxID=50390 RepID=A0A6P7GXL5_DIAVI